MLCIMLWPQHLQCCCLWMAFGQRWLIHRRSHFCILFVHTTQIEFSECCVCLQCLPQWCSARVFNLVDCCHVSKWIVCDQRQFVCFCLIDPQSRVSWVLCLSSVPHWLLLHHYFQCRSLIKVEWTIIKALLVLSFFLWYPANKVQWVLYLSSMPHLVMLLQFVQDQNLLINNVHGVHWYLVYFSVFSNGVWHAISSFLSVVFVFNPSVIAIAPSPWMQFPV